MILTSLLVFKSECQGDKVFEYDPMDHPAIGARVFAESLAKFKWLITNFDGSSSPGTTTIVGLNYDVAGTNNITEFSQTITGPVTLLAGTDEEHSCAIFVD